MHVQHNNEARSRYNCCRQKTVSDMSVSVALVIRRARAHAPWSAACLVAPHFSTLPPKRNDFRDKKLQNIKYVFRFKKKNTAKPVLPLWAFTACSRLNFTFTFTLKIIATVASYFIIFRHAKRQGHLPQVPRDTLQSTSQSLTAASAGNKVSCKKQS